MVLLHDLKAKVLYRFRVTSTFLTPFFIATFLETFPLPLLTNSFVFKQALHIGLNPLGESKEIFIYCGY